ncbi:MAG TPA: hypothetical protein VFK24_05390 [Gammaproteobacteria bacterium]|nr:hypothetical protein [Gammaproteobacteria bacterium]
MMRALLPIFLAVLAVAAPAFADVELRYTPPKADGLATQVDIHDGRVRIVSPAQPDIILYESAKHRFLILDTHKKTFRVVDQQAVTDLREDIARVKRLAQALPQSMRGLIHEHAPGVSALLEHPLPTATLAATGASVTVGRYRCRTITASINGGVGYGLCVTSASVLGIPKDDAQTLAAMAADLRRLAGRNLTLKPDAEKLVLEQVGVPVKYVDLLHGQTLLLKNVGHDQMSDDRMRVPPDYEQQPLIDIFG